MAERKKLSFEQAMERLEEIVIILERGEAPLEESLSLFEEGAKLMKQCSDLLDKAEQKVTKLTITADAELAEVPFGGGGAVMDWQTLQKEDCAKNEAWLMNYFSARKPYGDLNDAMLYSLMAGGKRVRPVLLLESCRMCGGDVEATLPFACAVEMVHTYSLIHDDLPCMDDDDLRRGKPTNHKVYGEATAVLAGDGLLTAAFEVMLEQWGSLPAERVLAAAACLGKAAGGRGMVGGQTLDMAAEGRLLTAEELEELYSLKTGALITAAAEMGCIIAGANEAQRKAVVQYAKKIGLAFQVQDDILDVEGDEAMLGKPIGSDARSEKNTYVSLKGLDVCKGLVETLTNEALASLEQFENSGFHRWLALQLAGREN